MPILRSPESEETKEMAKWEQYPGGEWCPHPLQPGNPYRYRPYPKMLYKAQQNPQSGKWVCSQDTPANFGFRTAEEWDRACQAAAAFTTSCQCIVNDETEHKRRRESGEGWCESPQEALEWRQKLQDQIAEAAAVRNWEDRNMTDKAKDESAAAEADHFGHLPEIPEKPKRRGRPPKVA